MNKSLEERVAELERLVAELKVENAKLRVVQPFLVGERVQIKSHRGYYSKTIQPVGFVGKVLEIDFSDATCFVKGASSSGRNEWVDFCDLELVQS